MKRLSNFPTWPTNRVPHLIAVPLFILAALLILSGLFRPDFTAFAVGIIGLFAALGLERQRRP